MRMKTEEEEEMAIILRIVFWDKYEDLNMERAKELCIKLSNDEKQ